MTKQNQDSPVNRGSVAVPRTPRPCIRPTGIQSEASRQPGETREASALGRSVVHRNAEQYNDIWACHSGRLRHLTLTPAMPIDAYGPWRPIRL